MQQPELGRRLTALRKEKNLTQEELVEKSHVSVRTIQRIEAGEVLPRLSTIKILLSALGETYESFVANVTPDPSAQKNDLPANLRTVVLVAAVAGAVYLVAEIVRGVLDITRFTSHHDWTYSTQAIYICLTVVMVFSFALFARGYIVLANVFKNKLLNVIAYMLIVAMIGMGLLDIATLAVEDIENLWLPYASASLIFGALSIAFGISLIRLQDGMGELARIAGMLEIVVGFLLVTVVLFVIAYVVLIPATVIEILVLYRGYEYLSRSE